MKNSAKHTAWFHLFQQTIHFILYSLIDKICFLYLMNLLILTISILPDSNNDISALNY